MSKRPLLVRLLANSQFGAENSMRPFRCLPQVAVDPLQLDGVQEYVIVDADVIAGWKLSRQLKADTHSGGALLIEESQPRIGLPHVPLDTVILAIVRDHES